MEATVRERARHTTSDKVGDTRSFANMEQTLTREYWGRFLIELLQNARDAWLASSPDDRDGLLRIRLTDDPALVVCNEGSPLTAEVVLHSISKFGESPKKPGEGIGHKGIGFKAVLELTHAPRLYSRADAASPFDLSVRFDPDEARRLVMRESPDWTSLVARLPSSAADSTRGDRIPILRFPLWDDAPPAWRNLAASVDGRGFNTIIGLPFDERFELILGVTREEFVGRVQAAFADVSDEVVLLLGVFGRLLIEDETAGTTVEIKRSECALQTAIENVSVREVEIRRNDNESSRWWLFERTLPGFDGLEGDLAVAVRLEQGPGGRFVPVAPRDELRDGSSADCFHLFFPTRIRTHLPYLLHAYFEVDAARKGFAEDRAVENQVRLDGLRALAVDAVRHLVGASDTLDAARLPALFAATAGEPDDPLARAFREGLLAELDDVPWVATSSAGGYARPADLFVDQRVGLAGLLPVAFPELYIQRRVGRSYPRIEDADAVAFLARRVAVARGLAKSGIDADTLGKLLRPGSEGIWDSAHDVGFRALLEVLDVVKRDVGMPELIEALRSDASAVLIPVLAEGDTRRLRAPGREPANPDDEEPEAVGAILARVTATTEAPLVPPKSLGLDFLADGVLDAERLAGIGAKLGIRPYLTEVIIDALARAGTTLNPDEALPFTWRLLLRERGKFSIINVLRTATTFEPGLWFWSKADGNTSESEREDVRRARALARVRLPARDGTWRLATELAFGGDWADWIEAHSSSLSAAAPARADAYRDLELVAPGPSSLLASPERMLEMLALSADDTTWVGSDTAPELPTDPSIRHLVLVHAFLLRLGVWEIPPIKGHVNYRYPRAVAGPPWSGESGWTKHRKAQAASSSGFAQFGHGSIQVAEDFAFQWPLTADPNLVRALSRGSSFYRGYRRSELFCPTCSAGGARWHTKRYSTDGDIRIASYLAWQLTEEAWIPTTTWGSPTVAAHPKDAWLADDRPDDTKMQQSWQRFLPIADSGLGGELAALAGVRRLNDADVDRIGRLLRTLRERFESGDVDPERRAGSFASQTFVGLHWRLYEQLAARDAAAGRQLLDEVGVLSALGRTLAYRSRADVREDDGSFSGFRRYFAGQQPFAVLTKEQGPVADMLDIARFRVDVERVHGTTETSVTAEVRPFLHDRAAEFLALQAYHPIGAKALLLDGREFPLRAERLRRLEVVRVDDLVLRLSVQGTDLVKEIGAGQSDNLFLDTAQNPPVLYLDLNGLHWEQRFRALAGPHLAVLLDNPAYEATFQLLLQAEDEGDVEEFMEERSIAPEDVELVRRQMGAVAGAVRDEERRWWQAVLELLGAAIPDHLDGDAFRRDVAGRLEDAVHGGPVLGLAERLLRAGGGEVSRHDASADGALAALEANGIDLALLHQRLVELGDRGLTIQVAAQRLNEWRRAHGREVTAILADRRVDEDAAKVMPERWTAPGEVRFQTRPSPSAFLRDVLSDLRSVGIEADADELTGPAAGAYLARLAGIDEDRLAAIWNGLFDENERRRLSHERAQAWRRVLRPIVVAARTSAGDTGHLVRAEASLLDGLLPASPSDVAEVVSSLATVLVNLPDLTEMLCSRILGDRSLSEPSVSELAPDLAPFLDLHHLDQVIAILRRGRNRVAEQARQDLDEIREQGLSPAPFVASTPPQPNPPKPGARKTVVRPRRVHDQKTRDRLGIKGERVALAAVLDQLFALPTAGLSAVIDQLVELLTDVASGEIVDRLVAEAQTAQSSTDEDDRLEALVRFLHVAQESDDFGFDVLGYLAPYQNAAPRPLLLEVKNSANRRFIASIAEWRRAEEQGDRYAFFVVVRQPKSDVPASLELIPDPGELLRLGQISRDEDSWAVAYDPV